MAQLALFHPGLGWWCANLSPEETLWAAGQLAELVAVKGGKQPN